VRQPRLRIAPSTSDGTARDPENRRALVMREAAEADQLDPVSLAIPIRAILHQICTPIRSDAT
jgi:hypothetical protein